MVSFLGILYISKSSVFLHEILTSTTLFSLRGGNFLWFIPFLFFHFFYYGTWSKDLWWIIITNPWNVITVELRLYHDDTIYIFQWFEEKA